MYVITCLNGFRSRGSHMPGEHRIYFGGMPEVPKLMALPGGRGRSLWGLSLNGYSNESPMYCGSE